MRYHDSLNVDILPFNPSDKGGLYVTNLHDYSKYHDNNGDYASICG